MIQKFWKWTGADRRGPAQTGADRRRPAQTDADRRRPAIFSNPGKNFHSNQTVWDRRKRSAALPWESLRISYTASDIKNMWASILVAKIKPLLRPFFNGAVWLAQRFHANILKITRSTSFLKILIFDSFTCYRSLHAVSNFELKTQKKLQTAFLRHKKK